MEMRRRIVTAAAVIALPCATGACASTDNEPAADTRVVVTTASSMTPPLTSIPYCEPVPTRDEVAPRDLDDDFWDNQASLGSAALRVEAQFAGDPTWSGYVVDPVNDLAVFRFTTSNDRREQRIQGLLGTDYTAMFELVPFSASELENAYERLHTRIQNHDRSGSDLGIEGYDSGGSLHSSLLTIHLRDHTDAAHLADRLELPAPYEPYCIEPPTQTD
jgi:hypothetical protein